MSDKKPDRAMPLRLRGHQVDLVRMPGRKNRSLGRVFDAQDSAAIRRAASVEYWQPEQQSPRKPAEAPAGVRQELDLRSRTVLTTQLPEEVQRELDQRQSPSVNAGRKQSSSVIPEKITIKIGD